ncbi:hypothetical protein O6H91_01G148200 [Diphasiastrum complanatum]|uniref:Uncharacterized protein n=1 Tax=Diphasiastrum complanatum TaxID=34168 RepID=A0ACC2EXK8_DIPCM|nr:hypothetical protein O6H91_01G148200 [Diphasiastrum complanatum]
MAAVTNRRIFGLVCMLIALQYLLCIDAEADSINGRHLLQAMESCSTDFSKVDYSSVTSVCKQPDYDLNACCSTFKNLACAHQEAVNNFQSTCPIEFMAFLNMNGNYPNGVFVGRCKLGSSLC